MRLSRRNFHAAMLGSVTAGALREGAQAQPGAPVVGPVVGEAEPSMLLPAQAISAPASVSPQARAFLVGAARRIAAANAGQVPPEDQAKRIEAGLRMMRPRAAGFVGSFTTIDLPGGAKLYRLVPGKLAGRRAEVAYFDIHGGGYTGGGGEMCQVFARVWAATYGVRVYSVDYRLAPQHPYPAALDDTIAAYRKILLEVPAANIVVAGASAGGGLASALLLKAKALDLPMPAALLLLSPSLDLSGAGDTRATNRFLDVMLYGQTSEKTAGYVGSADSRDPFVSPVYGSFGSDWPPTLLASGTRDLLLSDSVRMHRALRRAGVRAELHVCEAAPHGGFMGSAPEDADMARENRRFCEEAWGISG